MSRQGRRSSSCHTPQAGLLLLFLLAAAAMATSGCTLAGLAGGAIHDAATPRRERVASWEVNKLEPGTKVQVLLRDGGLVEGRFRGLEPRSGKEYEVAYERAREALRGEAELPLLGEGAQVRTAAGRQADCELLGFHHGTVVLREAGLKRDSLVALTKLEKLADREGLVVTGRELGPLVRAGKIPHTQVLTVEVDSSLRRVPIEDVTLIEVVNKRNGVATGALIGAVADALIIVAVASAGSNDPPPSTYSSSGESSCPYVYSFDGQGYVLDAEPFGGAFTEVAQRSDWSRLDHLREDAGVYRLRLANELQEIEHVDEVKLLVADHPLGSQLAPDLYGRLHTLSATVGPSAAHDLRGADVSRLVAHSDGSTWLGNPFGRDPNVPSELRAGLVLEFPRPPGAREATLVVRARSTPWTPELLHHLLALKGRELDHWYESLAVDARARGALDNLALEAVPTISLWTGNSWKPVDFLGALSTATFAIQAVPLKLPRSPADVLRLRIDGLPGTWRIDSAVVGFDSAPPARVRELLPSSARTREGRDVRKPLERIDRERHVLENGDAVELTFAAPPLSQGFERSFVLKATGYYKILLPAGGEPQTARFDELLGGRGALARYSLELLEEKLRLGLAQVD